MDHADAMDRLWNRLSLLEEDIAIARFGATASETEALAVLSKSVRDFRMEQLDRITGRS